MVRPKTSARRRRVPRHDDPRPPAADVAALTVPEAAYLLRCSSRQIWRYVRSGELPSFRLGRAVRVSRQALDAFMAAGGAAATEESA